MINSEQAHPVEPCVSLPFNCDCSLFIMNPLDSFLQFGLLRTDLWALLLTMHVNRLSHVHGEAGKHANHHGVIPMAVLRPHHPQMCGKPLATLKKMSQSTIPNTVLVGKIKHA